MLVSGEMPEGSESEITADLPSRPDESHRVEGFAVPPYFVMEVRTRRAAAAADRADDVPGDELLADPHLDLAQMAVARREAAGMLDFHHAPVAALPACLDDLACGRHPGGRAGRSTKVHSRMHRRPAEEGVLADTEGAGHRSPRRRAGNRQAARLALHAVEKVERRVELANLDLEHCGTVELDQRPADAVVFI